MNNRILKLIVVLGLVFATSIAQAQKVEDVAINIGTSVLIESGKSTIKKYALKRADEYLFKWSHDAGSIPLDGQGYASQAVPYIDLGLTIYDLTQAKTDKQKTKAGLRTTAAILTLSGNPAGAVMTTILLINDVSEALLSAASAEKMMQLEKEINDNYAVIKNVLTSFSKADQAVLGSLYSMREKALSDLSAIEEKIKNQCLNTNKVKTIEDVRNCVELSVQAINSMKAYVRLTVDFFRTPLMVLNRQDFFRDQKNNIDDFLDSVETIQVKIKESEEALSKDLAVFSNYVYETLLKEAEKESYSNIEEDAFNLCYSQSLNLIQQAVLLKSFNEQIPEVFGDTFSRINNDQFDQAVDFFKEQKCWSRGRQQVLYSELIKNLQTLDTLLADRELK